MSAAPASWVVVERSTGLAVLETFDPRVAAAVNATRYEVVAILAYLQRFARSVRNSA